ncbi:TrbI/VirB10 family protein [Allosphingosinicella humi]
MSDIADTGDAPAAYAAIAPRKVDPETLVLRANPGRIIRFKRGAIVGIVALTSTAMAGLTWVALTPDSFGLVADGGQRDDSGGKASPDALANAPKSYGDVPQLGAPLPGDLGRPILEHERSLGAAPIATTPDPAAQAAEAERRRIAAERKAARESGVMMQMSGADRSATAAVAPTPPQPAASPDAPGNRLALDPDRDPGGQQRKADFVATKDTAETINPHALVAAPSPYMISAGTVIAASLITGLDSDLPGLVTAQVTENCYDSATGRILLVPQGSRLIGSYDSVVAFGQKRALVVWQRIILPDGSSIQIDNMPATDTAGYTGLSDKVDVHTWQLLKGVALSTLLGIGTQLSFGNDGDLVRALRESTQQSASRAGHQIVMKNLNVQPTLRVRPGWPLRLMVHKDLILRAWRMAER